ncbi:MAG: phosphonate C-P lyase system protein PhnH [Hydrogenophaga sp.]|uniref:phosphonate C-P lyase system protein PhnH n=1 Tax=Hydrogenophaga sp. TaxID=1904254 RepID=UPI00261FACF2|nr:phosphonate C-P lyase system protein PhnH [Hydrogenophaga sp.]MDM7942215.1 phosphonate C-P lyase system protein PhnH [Hydrogenophaga sp.]
MSADALQDMRAGFSSEALGSQAVFRVALHALSHPGRILPMPIEAECPGGGHGAAAVLLLALLDADCTLWLSPRLAASPTAAWLRFHTGCRCVEAAAGAQFVWVAQGDTVPDLATLAQGTDVDPQGSATLVLELAAFQGDERLSLSGPGIQTVQGLDVTGLPPGFVAQWAANHAAFPRGVDVYLTTLDAICGLPRTVHINAGSPVEA